MYVVADSSVFIWGRRPDGDLVTTPAVVAELKDLRTKSLFHIFETQVASPSHNSLKMVQNAAVKTGDIRTLSCTDMEVLALALQYGAALATDDYAMQNVALHLGLVIKPIGQPKIKRKRIYIQKCRGCGKSFEGDACPDCGTPAQNKKRGGKR